VNDDDVAKGVEAISKMTRFLAQAEGVKGLDRNGRVVTHWMAGSKINTDGKLDLSSYSKAKDLVHGLHYPIGGKSTKYTAMLFEDGTVQGVYEGNRTLHMNLSVWKDVACIQESRDTIVDLTQDEQVLYASANNEETFRLNWPPVRKVMYGVRSLIGLSCDGDSEPLFARARRAGRVQKARKTRKGNRL